MVGSTGFPGLRPDTDLFARGAEDAFPRPLAEGAAFAGAKRVTMRIPCRPHI